MSSSHCHALATHFNARLSSMPALCNHVQYAVTSCVAFQAAQLCTVLVMMTPLYWLAPHTGIETALVGNSSQPTSACPMRSHSNCRCQGAISSTLFPDLRQHIQQLTQSSLTDLLFPQSISRQVCMVKLQRCLAECGCTIGAHIELAFLTSPSTLHLARQPAGMSYHVFCLALTLQQRCGCLTVSFGNVSVTHPEFDCSHSSSIFAKAEQFGLPSFRQPALSIHGTLPSSLVTCCWLPGRQGRESVLFAKC